MAQRDLGNELTRLLQTRVSELEQTKTLADVIAEVAAQMDAGDRVKAVFPMPPTVNASVKRREIEIHLDLKSDPDDEK